MKIVLLPVWVAKPPILADDTTIAVPRDHNATFHSPLVEPYQTSTNEMEDKIIGFYAKGVSTRDIKVTLQDLYGTI